MNFRTDRQSMGVSCSRRSRVPSWHDSRAARWPAAAVVLLSAALGACGPGSASYTVSVDGSSTVYPITEAMAEEFGIASTEKVNVTIATSGTGGGFKAFCAGERDISNASRHIKKGEQELCEKNGVEFVEFNIAIDGLTIAVNPANTFVECLSVAELEQIWRPGSTISRWSEVRPEWPDEPIKLYGAGTNSGTFDYFTEAIMGRVGAIRDDFSASEDDNVLVQGVEGDRNALGFFGYAYYAENTTRLKSIAVDPGSGCVQPTPESIQSGVYAPLARPLLIYVSRKSMERSVVRDFVRFYLENSLEYVPETGYVALPADVYAKHLETLAQFEAAAAATPAAP
jgi:phosphate transport system substrate-binding protein